MYSQKAWAFKVLNTNTTQFGFDEVLKTYKIHFELLNVRHF